MKSVSASVTGIAVSTTATSRRPSTTQMSARHAEHGEEHVPEQLVALLGRRLAVVAREGHAHVAGISVPSRPRTTWVTRVADVDGVGALALGHGEGHRGRGALRLRLEHDVAGGSAAPSTMVATSPTSTGRPPRVATTTRATSAAFVKRSPTSTLVAWPPPTGPTRGRAVLARRAPAARPADRVRTPPASRIDRDAELPWPSADERDSDTSAPALHGVAELAGERAELVVAVGRRVRA
jgi:hypothetical protein